MDMGGALPVAYGFDATSDTRNSSHAPSKRISHMRFGSMAIIPQSKTQWRRHLAAVKRDYSNCRYRECVIKCESLLEDAKDSDCVGNSYTVFLHFYAATALEMQCRRVHHASKARLDYLTQARGHYQDAAMIAAAEEQTMSHSSLCSLSPSSTLDSTFSQQELASTRASSLDMYETEHVESFEKESGQMSDEEIDDPSEDEEQGQPDELPNGNTTVTLDQELKDTEDGGIHEEGEQQGNRSTELVMSRPDSPTLGFDEWLGRSSPDILPPLSSALDGLKDDTEGEEKTMAPGTAAPISEIAIIAETARECSEEHQQEPLPSNTDSEDDEYLDSSARKESPPRPDPYAVSRSINHYRSTLASLRTQIASHLSHVTSEISSFNDPISSRSLILSDEMRKMELQARIERLKAAGWKRRVFDADRYEALRDGAMGDMLN